MRTKKRIMVIVLTGMLLLLSLAVSPTFARNSTNSQTLTQLATSNPYNNVPLPSPPWWNGYQCDSNHYNNDTTDNPNGLQAKPLGSTTYRGEVACGPMPLNTSNPKVDVPVNFTPSNPNAPKENEWECTELVKRYLYQAFGAPDLPADGKDVVNTYYNNNELFDRYLNTNPPTVTIAPLPGDVLSFDATSNNSSGHAAIVYASTVDGTGNGTLSILEQNNTNDPKGIGTLYVGNPKKKDPGNPAWHIDTEKNAKGNKVLGDVTGWLRPKTIVNSNVQGQLYGISANAADDVWAVGNDSPGGIPHSYIKHWDGSHWNDSSTTDFSYLLRGVSADASNDVWAVGYTFNGLNGAILHYDGTTWQDVSSFAPVSTELLAVKAISSTDQPDQWFAGVDNNGAELIHHTGTDLSTNWTYYDSANTTALSGANQFLGIDASSSGNVWAVGSDTNNKGFVAQWTGSSWSHITSAPNPGAYLDGLLGVHVLSTSSVYIVGDEEDTVSSPSKGMILHWAGGTTWDTPVFALPAGMNASVLNGIDAISGSNIWTVGYSADSSGNQYTMIYQYNGTSWKQITSPNPTQNDKFTAISIIPQRGTITSNGNTWIVGNSGPGPALIEFYN